MKALCFVPGHVFHLLSFVFTNVFETRIRAGLFFRMSSLNGDPLVKPGYVNAAAVLVYVATFLIVNKGFLSSEKV